MPLPDFTPGTIVQLTGGGLGHWRKLTARSEGRFGLMFCADDRAPYMTEAEALGTFEWISTCDGESLTGGRDARVRSVVSGRVGVVARSMMKAARRRQVGR